MHFTVFFVLVTAATTYAETNAEQGAVLDLNTSNFEDAIKENEFVLISFFVPWCSRCEVLDLAFSEAAKQLKDEGSSIKLARVLKDATTDSGIAQKYGISVYPTLAFFISGVPVFEYTGELESEDIVTWLKKKTGPPAKHLKDKDSIAAFKNEAEVAVVGFFKDQASDNAKVYLQVARHVDDVLFGITSDSESFADHKVEGDSILLFKQFDEVRSDFEGEFNETKIRNFVFLYRLPSVIEFNRHTVQNIFTQGPVKHQVVLFSKKEDSDALIREVREVAKAFRGQFIFVYVDTQATYNDYLLSLFGLDKDTTPVVRMYLENENLTKYQPKSEGVDAASVRQFLQDYLDGNLEPLYLSEEIPEDWDSQPVKVLVGKNFKEVAYDKDKAVFVRFYAPWSGHCKHMKPAWDELGEAYKDSDKIVIAEIDGTLNEIEGQRITSYPTLKYFLSGSGQVIEYLGERTLEAFKAFLDSAGQETVEEEKEEVQDEEEKKPEKAKVEF